MTVSKTPPGRASTVMLSSGGVVPVGPQKWARWTGSVMHRKTRSRGASNTRSTWSSPRPGFTSGISVRALLRAALEHGEVGIELVEPAVPDPALLGHPVDGGVQDRHVE